MGKPAFLLSIALALLISVAAGPPAPSKLSDFGSVAMGAALNKLPAALRPSQDCLTAQVQTNKPCEVRDNSGVTYLVLGDHVSGKEIRRADPLPALPYGFSWSDTLADGERKMRDQFQLKKVHVQKRADVTLLDTGDCFLARRGGDYFRFYLLYDAQGQLKTLGTALCVYL